jgi:hypothetical protein
MTLTRVEESEVESESWSIRGVIKTPYLFLLFVRPVKDQINY